MPAVLARPWRVKWLLAVEQGLALLDVISPCVTFNDHPGSTKSYDYGREHEEAIHELGFVPTWEKAAQDVDVPAGQTVAQRPSAPRRARSAKRPPAARRRRTVRRRAHAAT